MHTQHAEQAADGIEARPDGRSAGLDGSCLLLFLIRRWKMPCRLLDAGDYDFANGICLPRLVSRRATPQANQKKQSSPQSRHRSRWWPGARSL